ncbi:MAG: glycosyltransferase family 4 protein [Bacilli bacterium]
MRIVQIIPYIKTIGGAEKFVFELSVELQKLGNSVTIITFYKVEGFFDDYIKSNNLHVIYLNKKRGVDIRTSIRLRKLISRINPDIVHCHLNYHSTFFFGRIQKMKNPVFVETIHSTYIKNQNNPVMKKNSMLIRVISGWYKRKIVTPVAISDSVNDSTRSFFNLSTPIPLIYNGISLADLGSVPSISKRKFDFINVASFIPLKNQIAIVNAAKILKDKGYKFKITLVGIGPTFENVKNAIESNDLGGYISMLGQRKDIFELLKMHKVFLLPSLTEGNPLSVLEAMAAGLMVIATEKGGTVNLIKPNINGFLIDPNDYTFLASLMETSLVDQTIVKTISKNNLLLSSNFDIVNTARQYSTLYADLLIIKQQR